MRKCEYCNENLDWFYYYDSQSCIYFCDDCKYEHAKGISYIDIWDILRRNGEVKEVFVNEDNNEEQPGE